MSLNAGMGVRELVHRRHMPWSRTPQPASIVCPFIQLAFFCFLKYGSLPTENMIIHRNENFW